MTSKVRIDVLGPIRVLVDGAEVAVRGERRRRLLAALVMRRGVECRADWLADVVWDERVVRAAAAAATLQSHIAHLRKLLEPHRAAGEPWSVIRSVPGGYLLAVEHADVDVDRVLAAVNAGRLLSDPVGALALLERALAGRRGGAFADEADRMHFAAEAASIDEAVRSAGELRLELLARAGRDDEVVTSAESLIRADPLRESAWAHLAEALARLGRQADALRSLARLRDVLRDEVGLDPSPEIAELEQQLLQQRVPDRGQAGRLAVTPLPVPPTGYAASDDGVHIAYQVVGDPASGRPVLVAAPPLAQNIEICWEDPHHRRMIERAARRTTFLHFDKRGTGMSDRVVDLSLDQRLRDFEAVLDHAGIDRAVLVGVSESGPLAIAFAVAHPERVAGLALVNTFACAVATDHDAGASKQIYDTVTGIWEAGWGRHPSDLVEWFAPSLRGDDHYGAWLAHYMRQSCSPGTLRLINEANGRIDVRPLLEQVTVPALVLHRRGDRVCPAAQGRHLAEHIPGAELIELDGADHLPWIGDNWDELVDHVLDFSERVV